MDIENKQKDELFQAIWENFEAYEIIGHIPDESTTFLTSNKSRRFRKDNFVNSYQSGQMDIDDLVYILF